MQGSSHSLSSSSSFSTGHDVFLSFRSIDPSKRFVDYLCIALQSDGIRTLYYDSELGGREVASLMPLAINASKIIIVVLSKNYASSRWCLDELVNILRSKETCNQTVVPIFYHVDPDDVSHQTGEFGTAFLDMRKPALTEIGNLEVETWKEALTEIGNLSGYYIPRLRGWSELMRISEIAERVKLDISNYVPLHDGTSHHPVRLKSSPEIMKLVKQSMELSTQPITRLVKQSKTVELVDSWTRPKLNWPLDVFTTRRIIRIRVAEESIHLLSTASQAHNVDKTAYDDGYNWRKYGQESILGIEYPQSYNRCTQKGCRARKFEQPLDGQVTEVEYKGKHNHHPPRSSKHGKDTGNPNETSTFQTFQTFQSKIGLVSEFQTGNLNDERSAFSLSAKD